MNDGLVGKVYRVRARFKWWEEVCHVFTPLKKVTGYMEGNMYGVRDRCSTSLKTGGVAHSSSHHLNPASVDKR